jgi:hypothetical protein
MAGQWRFVVGGGGIAVNDDLALLCAGRPRGQSTFLR